MKELTVRQLAAISGVTVRTLHPRGSQGWATGEWLPQGPWC